MVVSSLVKHLTGPLRDSGENSPHLVRAHLALSFQVNSPQILFAGKKKEGRKEGEKEKEGRKKRELRSGGGLPRITQP